MDRTETRRKHCRRDRVFGIATAALAAAAMAALTGVTVDHDRAERLRGALERAAGAASLAVTRLPPDHADPREAARRLVAADLRRRGLEADQLEVALDLERTPGVTRATVRAEARTPAGLGGLLDHGQVAAESQAAQIRRPLEIALALDLSGSMASNGRMGHLRAAATRLMEILLRDPADAALTRITLTPFGAGAKLPLRYGAALGDAFARDVCAPLDALPFDAAPNARPGAAITARDWRAQCAEGDNRALFRDNDLGRLTAHLNGLRPSGVDAPLELGARWSLAALLPEWRRHLPPAARAETAPGATLRKLILVTDGALGAPYSVGPDGRIAPAGPEAEARSARLRAVCAEAARRRVEVYTIGFDTLDARMLSALEHCASSPLEHFRPRGAAIGETFEAIAYRLSLLRRSL